MRKAIHVDQSGRINLGKPYAGKLFMMTQEKGRLVLEPAKLVSESEIASLKEANAKVLLSDKEWEAFEKFMGEDDTPNTELRKLLKDDD